MTTPRIAQTLERVAAKLRSIELDDAFPLYLIAPGLFVGIPLFFYAKFVISHHADAYIAGGAPHDEAYAGAITSQIIAILGMVAVVAVAHRGLHRALRVVAIAAGSFAVVFAVLPYLVAAESPLTILLSLLTALLFDAVLAAPLSLIVLRLNPPYREEVAAPVTGPTGERAS